MRRSVLSVAVVMITALVVGLFAASTPSRAQANARVNILHLAPFAATIDDTAVTVVVNGATLASDFKYKDAPLTATLPPGDYTVEVFAGTDLTVAPAITATVTLASGVDYTVFAGGDGTNIPLGLFPLVDDNSVPAAPNANVRVVHAAPFAAQAATAVDVRNATTDEVIGGLTGVEFGVASGYLPIPGATDIPVKVVPSSDPTADPPLIGPATLNVPPQSITTIFAIGTGTDTYPAEFFFLGGAQRVPAQVRLAHLAPFAGGRAAVNVVVPGDTPLTLVSDFGFGDTTDYVPLLDGTYPINVVIPSAPRALADTVAISGSVTLAPGMRYTAMAIGGANGFDPELVLLNDPITPPITDTARVRIYHAAPFAPGDGANVSIRTQEGAVVGGLANVPYKGTATLELPAGVYDLIIATPDGATTLLDIPAFVLAAGDDITVFAVGDGVNQDVGLVVLPRDGIVPPAEVRLAHLAPFAGGRAAVNVVVPTVPPVTLASDFGFGETTGFLRLPGGTYPINVVIPSMPASLADTVAISGSVTLAPGMRYTAMAIGGANGFAPELVLLTDPTDPPAAGTARVRIYHAAPFAAGDGANVSIRLQDGTVVPGLGNVPYKGTATFPLPPGTYDLIIATPDGATTLLDLPPFTLVAGDDITVFAVGDGVNQDVGTVVLGLPEAERFRVYLPFVAN